MYATPLYGSKPAGRYSISRKPPPIIPTPRLQDEKDDLMDMDIPVALLLASSTHSYSACPFKNPRELAENLLFRYQTDYRERTIALREMVLEREALVEEKQGAATRAFQLKTQLDLMSASLSEQDEVMINLVNELAQEKLARREEREARRQSLQSVTPFPAPSIQPLSPRKGISVFGIESEDGSSTESVISSRTVIYSPITNPPATSTPGSPEVYHLSVLPPKTPAPRASCSRLATNRPITAKPAVHQANPAEEPTKETCTNCHGVEPSEAWPLIGVLKEENADLKERIHELEVALNGCLEMMSAGRS